MSDGILNEHWSFIVGNRALEHISAMDTPSMMFKPKLSIDGNMWCASYGDMPDGLQGLGESPAHAMADFDKKYYEKLKPKGDQQ